MNRRTTLLLGGAALVAGGGWLYSNTPGSTPLAPLGSDFVGRANAADLPAVQDMSLGNADAAVTIVEYASFTCPHCKTFHENTLSKIKANYVDTGKVRFVFREVYFDRPGLWAGMTARCGGDLRYFGIVDLLFEKQREWATAGDAPQIVENLRTIGRSAGLNNEQLDACLSDGEFAQALVASYEENAKADNINSTPSFVINGENYSNMGYDEFASVLDEKLAQ